MAQLRTNLILVEGISGAGKSTTAQFLESQLLRQGIAAEWFHESGADNPLRRYYDAREGSVEAFIAQSLSAWRSYAERRASVREPVHILESCLFQIPMLPLLLEDVAAEVILAYVRDILRILTPMSPALIYLRPGDIEGALRQACASRYEGLLGQYVSRNEQSAYGRNRGLAGVPGLIDFWQELRGHIDGLVEAWAVPTLTLDTGGGAWSEHYAAILEFLGLPEASPPVSRPLVEYTGIYSRQAGSGTVEFPVRLAGGRLTVWGLAPYLWEAGNPLEPRSGDVFLALSWPTEVRFLRDAGAVSGFTLHTRAGPERGTDEVFRRVRPLDA